VFHRRASDFPELTQEAVNKAISQHRSLLEGLVEPSPAEPKAKRGRKKRRKKAKSAE